jgi:[acyl-carrier-protein] S-malonyltransferase
MKFAFIFPGQGSQSLDMLSNLSNCKIIQDTFAIAKSELQIDFLEMLNDGDATRINSTINTQPLLLTHEYALYKKWSAAYNFNPNIVAGHSLGEWSALVISGVISFSSALSLVQLRAKLMQQAVQNGDGGMIAVLGLSDEIVVNVCNEIATTHNTVVSAVNFNAPMQVVVAGNINGIELASKKLSEQGARKIIPLPVSVPSHCSLMQAASEKMAQALNGIKFNAPQIPIIHNYNTEIYTDVDLIKQSLIKQLYSPVLWSHTIKKIVSSGIINFIECGPGKVLTGLNKRIDATTINFNLNSDNDFQNTYSTLTANK